MPRKGAARAGAVWSALGMVLACLIHPMPEVFLCLFPPRAIAAPVCYRRKSSTAPACWTRWSTTSKAWPTAASTMPTGRWCLSARAVPTLQAMHRRSCSDARACRGSTSPTPMTACGCARSSKAPWPAGSALPCSTASPPCRGKRAMWPSAAWPCAMSRMCWCWKALSRTSPSARPRWRRWSTPSCATATSSSTPARAFFRLRAMATTWPLTRRWRAFTATTRPPR